MHLFIHHSHGVSWHLWLLHPERVNWVYYIICLTFGMNRKRTPLLSYDVFVHFKWHSSPLCVSPTPLDMPWASACVPVCVLGCPLACLLAALPSSRPTHVTGAAHLRVCVSVCLCAHERRGARGGETVTFIGSTSICCKVWKQTLPPLGLLWVDRSPHIMPSFDEVLKEAGEFGRFQKRVFFLLCQTGITFSFLFASMVFLGPAPDGYWCRIPGAAELSERCGWTLEEEQNLTVLPLRLANGSSSGKCERLDIVWDNSVSCTSPLTRYGNHSVSNLPLAACHDNWVYKQPHSSIVSEVRKTPLLWLVAFIPVQDSGNKIGLLLQGSFLWWLAFLSGFVSFWVTSKLEQWVWPSVSIKLSGKDELIWRVAPQNQTPHTEIVLSLKECQIEIKS